VFRAVNQFSPEHGTFKTWLRQHTYHRSIDRQKKSAALRRSIGP